jgi:hypothetical protein
LAIGLKWQPWTLQKKNWIYREKIIRPKKKNICVFPIAWSSKLGSVSRDFYFLFFSWNLQVQYTPSVSTIILSAGRKYSSQKVRQIWESTLSKSDYLVDDLRYFSGFNPVLEEIIQIRKHDWIMKRERQITDFFAFKSKHLKGLLFLLSSWGI